MSLLSALTIKTGKKMVAEFKKLTKSAKAPTKGTTGYDIYADCKEAVCIYPHTSATIGTGLHIKAPDGYIPVVFAKNGLVLTRGLRSVSCIEGYSNDYAEYKVLMHNDSGEIRYIFPGDKIAQIVFMPYLPVEFEEEKQVKGTGHSGTQQKNFTSV